MNQLNEIGLFFLGELDINEGLLGDFETALLLFFRLTVELLRLFIIFIYQQEITKSIYIFQNLKIIMEVYHKIINNNSPNSLIPDAMGNFKRINPDKFTFLKSNQLIPGYVNKGNVLENFQTTKASPTTSYQQCQTQIKQFQIKIRDNQDKINKVLNQAKQNSCEHHYEEIEKDEKLDEEAKQISNMIEHMHSKASDIMYGRMNSTFSRNNVDISHKDLKKLKEHTSQQKMLKYQNTRKLMKKSHNNIKKAVLEELKNDSKDMSFSNVTMLSDSSFMSTGSVKSKKILHKTNQNYKKLRKQHSHENIFNAERRKASKDAFGFYWQQGSRNKDIHEVNLFESQRNSLKPLKKNRRMGKPVFQTQSAFEKVEKSSNPQFINNRAYTKVFNKQADKFLLSTK